MKLRTSWAATRSSGAIAALMAAYAATLIAVPASIGIEIAGSVVTPARLLLAALALAYLVDSSMNHQRPRLDAIAVTWIVFLAAGAVTTLGHFEAEGVARLGSMAVEGAGLFFIARRVGSGNRSRAIVLQAWVYSTALVSLASAVLLTVGMQYEEALRLVLGLPTESEGFRDRFGWPRIEGSFDQPLFFAVLLAASGVLAAFLVDQRIRKKVSWLAAVSVILGLILTASRAAAVLAPLAVTVFLSVQRRLVPALLALMISASTAGFAVWITVSANSPRQPELPSASLPAPAGSEEPAPSIEEPTRGEAGIAQSGALRLEALKAALEAVNESPLFGRGLLRGPEAIADKLGSNIPLDSSYLQMLVEMGVVGLTAFVALVAVVMRPVLVGARDPEGAAYLAALFCLVVMSGLSSYLHLTQGYASLWLLGGLAVGWAATRTGRRPAADGSRICGGRL